MKTPSVALTGILVFSLLAAFTSCSGQSPAKAENSTGKPAVEAGAIVSRLGDSLWYVFQDRKNNLWFGSNGQGVFRYDGKTIRNFTTKNGLSNDSIRQILEDESGNMYFSTLGGISKFDGVRFTTLQPVKSNDWKLEKNDLWFFMLGKRDENGPYRYDGKTLYHLAFPKHFLHDEFYARDGNPLFSPYETYTIYKDRSGALWFGTSGFGACRFDGKTVKWMYERDLTIVPNGGSFGIRSIYEDRQGSFWICNTLHRYIFNLEETAKSDRLQYRQITGIGNKQAFGGDEYIYYSHIIEDNQGAIWLTTWSQGVYKYDGKTITHYPVKDGLKDINLVSMYKDNQGNLWLGTPENGTFKFNGTAFERFRPGAGIQ
jgi:ligand-binding sensor domain-containing protein